MGGSRKRIGRTPSAEDDTNEWLGQLERNKNHIIRIEASIRGQVTPPNVCETECRLGILNGYIEKAFELQQQLEAINNEFACREELEELCVSAKALLMSNCNRAEGERNHSTFAHNSSLNSSASHSRILPQMKLPKFDGNKCRVQKFYRFI